LIQGLLLVFMLTWGLGYAGLLLPEGFVERSFLAEFFIARNILIPFIAI